MFKEPNPPQNLIRIQKLSENYYRDFKQASQDFKRVRQYPEDTMNALEIFDIEKKLIKLLEDTKELYEITGSISNYQLIKLIEIEINKITVITKNTLQIEKEDIIKWATDSSHPDEMCRTTSNYLSKEEKEKMIACDDDIIVITEPDKIPVLANRRTRIQSNRTGETENNDNH